MTDSEANYREERRLKNSTIIKNLNLVFTADVTVLTHTHGHPEYYIQTHK